MTIRSPYVVPSHWQRAVRAADGVNRADQGLRSFALREGDAVFCRKCDGAGYVPLPDYGWDDDKITKCARCNGEGLEPTT